MILNTIELSDNSLTLEQLQQKVANGEFDFILEERSFLYITTDNGVVKVNKDKTIDSNAAVQLENYVKSTDYATRTQPGIVTAQSEYGIKLGGEKSHLLVIVDAEEKDITARTDSWHPITANNLNFAVKAALSDEKRINDMTDEEKANARGVIGAADAADLNTKQDTLTFDDVPTKDSSNVVKSGGIYTKLNEKINISDIADDLTTKSADRPLSAKQGQVLDAKKADVATLNDYVKFTNLATTDTAGVVKISDTRGIGIESTGIINISKANDSQILSKLNNFCPIVPANLDYAVRSVSPISSTSLPTTAAINTIYSLGEQTDAEFTATLPKLANVGDFIEINFLTGDSIPTLSIKGETEDTHISDYDLELSANSIYTLYCDYGVLSQSADGTLVYGWRIGNYEYTYTEA